MCHLGLYLMSCLELSDRCSASLLQALCRLQLGLKQVVLTPSFYIMLLSMHFQYPEVVKKLKVMFDPNHQSEGNQTWSTRQKDSHSANVWSPSCIFPHPALCCSEQIWQGVGALNASTALNVPDQPHLGSSSTCSAHILRHPFKLRPEPSALLQAILLEVYLSPVTVPVSWLNLALLSLLSVQPCLLLLHLTGIPG